jgi:hypothetical protein
MQEGKREEEQQEVEEGGGDCPARVGVKQRGRGRSEKAKISVLLRLK